MKNDFVEQITQWLRAQLKETNTDGFVLGLSGGLDSAVCAALIRRATDNCLGIILPIESDVKDLDDAASVASTLDLKTEYIDLTTIYNNLVKLMPAGDRLAFGNIKARLRMIVLYYHANVFNYLVCGTGNKTEISLGYFTKYGDGACDILPLGDLYKGEVKDLARTFNIPEKVLEKVPSAGLWAGQTDEGEIGCTYDRMDEALRQIEKGQIGDDIARRLYDMVRRTAHKREKPKICPLRR
ncbi:MAG: NAD+ synthase [candidate division WOR-3 bacterium]|nr:MAG: NAD+ synthase [candidate division WOR-3 bacterium]